MDVGLVGTGRLGSAIGTRLLECEHRLFVWNRTDEKARPLVDRGAIRCATPADLAATARTVLSVVTDASAIESVYFGSNGLLTNGGEGKTFVELSTVRPETQRRLAERVRACGGVMVECPVSGTASTALQGKLLALAAGDAEDVERVRPLLGELCRRVDHVGPIGAGASVKLAINLPLIVYWQALSEALSLIDHLGMDPHQVVNLLADTSGGPNVLRMRGEAIAEALAGRDPGPAHFTVGVLRKDLRAMLEEAAGLGAELPVVATVLACYEKTTGESFDTDGVKLPAIWLEHLRTRKGA